MDKLLYNYTLFIHVICRVEIQKMSVKNPLTLTIKPKAFSYIQDSLWYEQSIVRIEMQFLVLCSFFKILIANSLILG